MNDYNEISQNIELEPTNSIVQFTLNGGTLYAHMRSHLTDNPYQYLPDGAVDAIVLNEDEVAAYENERDHETKTSRRKMEILTRLAELDIASIRPLRALKNGIATSFDENKLNEIEVEAEKLRNDLKRE